MKKHLLISRSYKYFFLKAIFILAYSILITACFDSTPEVATARKFMKALIVRDVDELQATVIPERQDEIVQAALISFGGAVLISELSHGKVKISYTGLKFHSLQKNKQEALVEVQGKVSFTYLSEPISKSFRFNLLLSKIDHRWLVANIMTP
ncbi:MAG: hypothetical protein WCG00_18260 [Hyphomicrobiales bacterium]